MVGTVTVILVVVALALAEPVFAPLSFALFVIAIIWPLQARLQGRLPKLVALAISIVVAALAIGTFFWVITWGFTRVGRFMVTDAPRLQIFYNNITDWLEGHGIMVDSLWAEHFNVGWLVGAFHQLTSMVNGTLRFSLVVLVYVILGLMEVDAIAQRLRALRHGNFGAIFLAGAAQTATKFRRYMAVRALMSLVTGVLVWGFIWLRGLPLAQEWGVIAFALNFIPVIGSFIATVLPTLFAVTQFGAWQDAVIVFVSLNLIQFCVGSYLEPRIAGGVLSMSPFLVLFSVFLWSYLWGIPGAFIGVPIMIAVLTVCEQHPSSRWIAEASGAPATNRT